MTPPLTFVLLCGVPAAGKSTYAAKLRGGREEIVYLCPDLLREQLTGSMADQSCNGEIFTTLLPQLVRSAAAEGRHVILDGTFITRKARRPFIGLAKELGYRVECHVLDPGFEVCCARNAARARRVPDHVLTRMRDQWQSPEISEGIDQIVLVEDRPAATKEQGTFTFTGEYSHAALVERAVRYVRNPEPHSQTQRWVLVKGVFGWGSTTSAALCRHYGCDPDELIAGPERCETCGNDCEGNSP